MVILNYTQITDKETALVVQDQLTSSVIAVYTDSGALQSVILGFYVMLADYFVRVVNKPFVIRVEEINNEIVLVFYCANYLLSGILSPSARFDPESKSVLHILEHHPEIISLINLLRNIRGSGYIKSGIDFAHITDTGVYMDQAVQGVIGFALIVSFPKNIPVNNWEHYFDSF